MVSKNPGLHFKNWGKIEEKLKNMERAEPSQEKNPTRQGEEIGGFASRSFSENFQLFAQSRHPLWSFFGLQKISEDLSK